LAAFSNVSGEFTRTKLKRVGLLDRFALAWGVDEAGAAKPDPTPFTATCARLGVPVGGTVHVGDRYVPDAVGACDAGLRGVWLDRPGADPRGRAPVGAEDSRVHTVTSLLDVVAIAVQVS
jgi:putative hydrolase of the HAD superfamily